MPPLRIGLIGLGLMGRGMGKNLLEKDFPLTVNDVAPDAVARLVERGAVAADSPMAVAAGADVVITVLPDGPDVEQAILGPHGVLAGSRPGTIIVDCSTIDPAVTQRVGDRVRASGCHMVDAGMGRSSQEADEGRLIFMVGAAPADYEAVLPVLRAMGTDIFHCGGPGAGITMKVVNNLLATSILCADVEALVLGARAGLDVDTMLRVFTATAANNAFFQTAIPRQVLTGNYEPGFKAALAHKDVGLGQSLAARLGVPLFTLAPARQLYSLVLARGLAGRAHSIIAAVLAEIAGVRLTRK